MYVCNPPPHFFVNCINRWGDHLQKTWYCLSIKKLFLRINLRDTIKIKMEKKEKSPEKLQQKKK